MAPSDEIPPDVGQLGLDAVGGLANSFPVEDVQEIGPPLDTPEVPADIEGYGAQLQAEMAVEPPDNGGVGPFPVEDMDEIGPPLPTPEVDIEP